MSEVKLEVRTPRTILRALSQPEGERWLDSLFAVCVADLLGLAIFLFDSDLWNDGLAILLCLALWLASFPAAGLGLLAMLMLPSGSHIRGGFVCLFIATLFFNVVSFGFVYVIGY